MSDYSELKRLAEACIAEDEKNPNDVLTIPEARAYNLLLSDYENAANPAAILALLAENDGLHAQHGRDSQELRSLCQSRDDARKQRDQLKAEVAGLKTGYEAYEAQNAALRREVEALRIALESCADELEGQVVQCYHGQPVADMHPVVRRSYDRDMLCVTEARAAMGKGEQS